VQSEFLEGAEESAEKVVNGSIAAFWISSSCAAIMWTVAGASALASDVRIGVAFACAAAGMTLVTGRTAKQYVGAMADSPES
jgi:hypothetical protein